MDLKLMQAGPSAEERAAVDVLLGAPQSAWHGAEERSTLDHRIARGGREARDDRHLLLPALHALQGAAGWISPGGMNYVCERLTVPPAEAYGVATFYAMFSTEERPPTVLHVCDDIACRRAGGAELAERLAARRGFGHAEPVSGALRAGTGGAGPAGRHRSDLRRDLRPGDGRRRGVAARSRRGHGCGADRTGARRRRGRSSSASCAASGTLILARSTTTGRTVATRRSASRSSTARSGRSERSPMRS